MTDIDPIDPIELARLERAFDRLPDFHAAVFSALRHDNMTYAEIAERTGITPRHVEHIFADTLFRLTMDAREQRQGIKIHPVRRFLRDKRRDLRLFIRVWRDRL